MKFEIKDDLLFKDGKQVPQVFTKRKRLTKLRSNPDLVIHYTVGEHFQSMVAALSKEGAGHGSAHIVLGRDGEITQVEDFKTILWHAGKSYWKGRYNLNKSSIGIEVCCQGWLNERRSDGYWRQSWGNYRSRWHSPNEIEIGHHPDPATYIPTKGQGSKAGTPAWAQYTDKQIEVLKALVPVIQKHYNVREVVGHDDISPQRKQDPGWCISRDLFDTWNYGKQIEMDHPEEPIEPSPVSKYPVLGKGDSGWSVRRLQEIMNDLGYSAGIPDGDFGPRTERAVRAYQHSQGLTADGVVGPNTYLALGFK